MDLKDSRLKHYFNEKINKTAFDLTPFYMSRMRRHFDMNLNETQRFHMLINAQLCSVGLKSIGLSHSL